MNRTMLWLVCCGAIVLPSITATAQQTPRSQRYALLIGVNDYAPPLGKLEFCHNDMRDLQAHFVGAGFTANCITLMRDQAEDSALRPSKSNIEKQLELRLQLANENDLVVVAFSGHGVHVDGKSYLCPSDARLDANDSLISIDDVYAQMEACRATRKLLIIDACRNEPIVRGFRAGRLADDLAIEVQAPPKGLVVLSSCEAKQFSAEDAKLKHGVFMYYVMEGLKGAADSDTEVGGNANGRISLHELYEYAHEKTKNHVATSHRIVQRPAMRGEIVGLFELALVPNAVRLSELQQRVQHADSSKNSDNGPSEQPVNHRLLSQGDVYLRQGDYENAIRTYGVVVDDTTLDSKTRNAARKSRGAAYLARGGKTDIDKALIDQLAAGQPGIRMVLRAPSAELKVVNDVRGRLQRNQTVLVTTIAGNWLWVESVDGNDRLQGYLAKDAVLEQPLALAQPQTQVRSPTQHQQGYETRPNQTRPSQGGKVNIWKTPKWESLKEIKQLKAAGMLE